VASSRVNQGRQAAARAGTGLWLVCRGVRHGRSQSRQGVARRTRLNTVIQPKFRREWQLRRQLKRPLQSRAHDHGNRSRGSGKGATVRAQGRGGRWLNRADNGLWARPGETWHQAEFLISPSHGFQIAIDGTSIFNYANRVSFDARRQQNDQWNSEDCPRLVASYLEIPQGLNEYNWRFTNKGKEEATNIGVK